MLVIGDVFDCPESRYFICPGRRLFNYPESRLLIVGLPLPVFDDRMLASERRR